MKKALSLIVALAMLMSMASVVFANSTTGTTYTVDPQSGVNVNAAAGDTITVTISHGDCYVLDTPMRASDDDNDGVIVYTVNDYMNNGYVVIYNFSETETLTAVVSGASGDTGSGGSGSGGSESTTGTGARGDEYVIDSLEGGYTLNAGTDYITYDRYYKYQVETTGTIVVTDANAGVWFSVNDAYGYNWNNAGESSVDVVAGDTLYINIYNVNPYDAYAVIAYSDGSGSGNGGGSGVAANPLSVGTAAAPENNSVEAADCAWSYTATEAGTLHLTMGAAIMGPVDATYAINGGAANALSVNSFADVEMAAGDQIVINVTASGYATLRAGWTAGGSGTAATPLNVDIIDAPAYNSINAADCVWAYTATEDGTLVLDLGAAIMGPVEVTYAVNGGAANALAQNSSAEIAMVTGDEVVVNVTASGYATLMAGWISGGAASAPADLNVGTVDDAGLNSINAADCAWAYTATETGVLTLDLGAAIMGPVDVTYSVNGGAANALALSSQADIDMAAGDQIIINVTASGYATLKAAFAVPAPAGEPVASGTGSVTATTSIQEFFTPTADGILTVTISADPGFKFWVYKNATDASLTLPEQGTSGTYEYPLEAGVEYRIEMIGYADWAEAAATITYDISFAAAQIAPDWIDIDKSNVVLELGENNVDLLANTVVSLFDFVPAEAGTYKFTVPAGVTLEQYGYAAWNLMATAENGVLEVVATAAEQTIMIGLSGDVSSVNVTVEKTGNYVAPPETTYQNYTQTTPVDSNFVMPQGNFESIDITQKQTIVLGNDGYYHLGSFDGPVILVNLNSDGFTLATLYDAGAPITMRGEKYTGQDGKTYCYDYMSFITGGYYNYSRINDYHPLNADLMAFFQDYGAAQGWYMQGLSGFAAINAGGFDEDSAWMVAMGTVAGFNGTATGAAGNQGGNEGGNQGGNTGNQGGNTGNQGGNTGSTNPQSGDFGVVAAAIAMGMSAICGTAVVVKKKKEN